MSEVGKIAQRLGGRSEIIQLADVGVRDRFRKDFGDLGELALSIDTLGQLQDIVVCTNPAFTTSTPDDPANNGEKPYILLAGERRFRAMTELLQWTEARALIFDREPTELEMLEVEWEENGRRKDFSWKEDCAIKARIQEMREKIYGKKTINTPGASGTSLRDTAAELGVSPATMSLDVSLHKAVEAIPELFAECKTKNQARRIMNLAVEQIARAEASRAAMESCPLESRFRGIIDRYIIKDFFEGVADVPDGSIDFCEIDPPYAINLTEQKKLQDVRYSLTDYNEVALEDYGAFMVRTIRECYRVMSPNSFGVLWHAPDPWGPILREILETNNFHTTALTGKWIKPTGQTNQPSRLLANACEEFFYFWKGAPTLARQGRTNIFQYTPVPGTKKVHPTERPIELIQEILSVFCWKEARILVPFLGSGKTILAAETLSMKAFGFELSSTYKDGFIVQAKELFGGPK